MSHSVCLSDWEVVIGLETHVQLMTQTKMFSAISSKFGSEPNSQAGFVDLALPGTLPKPNKKAIELAIKFGLAVQGNIAEKTTFARKNYFYPDLPKGYQISQFDAPIVEGGSISVDFKENGKDFTTDVILTRAHLEEDAGKSIHQGFLGNSGVDLNRAGIPLLEIVTEPKIKSVAQAVAYARTLHELVVWLGISDGNMQEGSFRCDVNVSVKRKTTDKLGTRVEVKNLNSFRFLEDAVNFEISRQISILERGDNVIQETRLFDAEAQETRSMRSKENAHDYRYFPDPDLFPIEISEEWIDLIKKDMPELPNILRKRLIMQYGLNESDVRLLTVNRATVLFYENILKGFSILPDNLAAKAALNWLCGEFVAYLKRDNLSILDARITPSQLAYLIEKILNRTISNKSAKEVFSKLWQNGSTDLKDIDKIIAENGLLQLSDKNILQSIIQRVLEDNVKLVDEYNLGKSKALNALVGKVMKLSEGSANPAQVNELIREKLTILSKHV